MLSERISEKFENGIIAGLLYVITWYIYYKYD